MADISRVSVGVTEQDKNNMRALQAAFRDTHQQQLAAEKALFDLQYKNLNTLYEKKIELLYKEKATREKIAQIRAEKEKNDEIKVVEKLTILKEAAVEKIKADYKKKLAAATTQEEKNAIKKQQAEEVKQIKAQYKKKGALANQFREEQAKEDAKTRKKAAQEVLGKSGNAWGIGMSKEKQVQELLAANPGMTVDQANQALKDAKAQATMDALANFAKQLDSTINSIGGMQGKIDTRLQGLQGNGWGMRALLNGGSYWKSINKDITRVVGVSPLIKQSNVVENLGNLVGQGIAFDVEQRAFLQTISEKIATTFSATDGTLLRLVRIQQQDSTAARLGMESALTSFLNNMYETSEYMQSIAAQVRTSLQEAESLMGTKSAAAFEYQVQKWMGSMYSVGMNDNSVQGIASVLGQIAAGDISSLNGAGAGNLIIMAANKAGLSIADILSGGLNDSETNSLMNAMVDYLAGIYDETKDSRVVAQQYAQVFGVSASDLKAAANLRRSTGAIRNQNLNYGGMLGQLYAMAGTMYNRTSTGELLTNSFDNLKYSISAGIANNPILYATNALAGMLRDTVGGINIPSISYLGTGFDLETTVADLMSVGAMAGGLLGSLPQLLGGLATGGGFSGMGMLAGMGILPGVTASVARGTGFGLLNTKGQTTSESGYVGNANGSDIQKKTMDDASNDANQQTVEAQEENNDVTIKDVDEDVVKIYKLLSQVVDGTAVLHTVNGSVFGTL